MLRNRRTVVFTLVLPAALFFVIIGSDDLGRPGRQRQRGGVHPDLDGAVRRRADRGLERRRQRRDGAGARLVAPAPADAAQPGRLHPDAMVAVAMARARRSPWSSPRGVIRARAEMPARVLRPTLACSLFCTLFAALGVFVGYVVPGENAMQILGPGLAVLCLPRWRLLAARRGQRRVARRDLHPDVRRRRGRPLPADPRPALVRRVNAVAWLAIFVAGAAWRMSKDTARV